MSMHLGNESVEVSLPPSGVTLGSGAESNPTTGDLEQPEEVAPSSSSSSPSTLSSSDKKSKKKKLVVLTFLLIAALVAAIGVGVRSSSNSSANKSTSTAALGEFVTYDASSSSSKSGKSGTTKSSYSGSAKSGKSLTKSPTLGPTADPTSSPSTSCPDGSSTNEGEECRTSTPDDFNGGCPQGAGEGYSGFIDITFGDSFCGTISSFYDDKAERFYSDSDWYNVSLTTNTTLSVILTTDFDATLYVDKLGDVDPCPETTLRRTSTDIGNSTESNTYVISINVTAGDYSIDMFSDPITNPALSCPTPGNYTLTLIEGPIPGVEVTSASVSTTGNQMFDKQFN